MPEFSRFLRTRYQAELGLVRALGSASSPICFHDSIRKAT